MAGKSKSVNLGERKESLGVRENNIWCTVGKYPKLPLVSVRGKDRILHP